MSASQRKKSFKITNATYLRISLYSAVALAVLAGVAILARRSSEPTTHEGIEDSTPKFIPTVEPDLPAHLYEPETNEVVAVIDPKKLPHPAYDTRVHPSLPPKKYIPTVEEVEKARLGPDGKPRPMSIYKTPVEEALGIIFSTKLGMPPPFLPNIPSCTSVEQLNEFLERRFDFDADAPETVKENRLMMQQVRDELKSYLDEGGDIGGFVDYYVGELRASYEQWKTAQMMLVDMARAGDDAESLRRFRDAANGLLEEKGIRPLAVPPSIRRAMGEE